MTVQEQYISEFGNSQGKAVLMLITPEIAAEFLLKKTDNYRTVTQSVVNMIAASITKGQWKINGATIRFAKDGRLLDGQHRLLAIIKSGIAVASFVIFGLEAESDITIDMDGQLRKLSDHLSKTEDINCTLLAPVLKSLVTYAKGTFYSKSDRISGSSAVKILEDYPLIRQAVVKFSKKNLITTASVLAVCYFIIRMKHPNDVSFVNNFFDRLVHGDKLTEGNCILILRNIFINSKLRKETSGLQRKFVAAMILKTWNYHVNTNPKKRKFTKNYLLKDSNIPTPL